jgi:hypothetical protein
METVPLAHGAQNFPVSGASLAFMKAPAGHFSQTVDPGKIEVPPEGHASHASCAG